MKRSEINAALREAAEAFRRHHWFLPPDPRWDLTDFGRGEFSTYGLVLVNLAEQPEYCEKLMYCRKNQVTLSHHHRSKKEDIICRWGRLAVELKSNDPAIRAQVNGQWRDIPCNVPFLLEAGERITLTPGIRHAFWADSDYAILGEVSTANDDAHDNFFDAPDIARFADIEEDEPAEFKLVSDPS